MLNGHLLSISRNHTDMRSPISQLLIVVLLVCPYFCIGQIASGMAASHAPGLCSCSPSSCPRMLGDSPQIASECPSPSDDKTPEAPNKSRPDCLCHGAGAVGDGLRTVQVEDSPMIHHWLSDSTPLTTAVSCLTAISFEPPHQFPPFSTGRDVCALVGTLLL